MAVYRLPFQSLEVSLDRCPALLERVPRGYVDTRPAVARVVTLREAVADALGTLAVRRP
jgi:hypothetical protein